MVVVRPRGSRGVTVCSLLVSALAQTVGVKRSPVESRRDTLYTLFYTYVARRRGMTNRASARDLLDAVDTEPSIRSCHPRRRSTSAPVRLDLHSKQIVALVVSG